MSRTSWCILLYGVNVFALFLLDVVNSPATFVLPSLKIVFGFQIFGTFSAKTRNKNKDQQQRKRNRFIGDKIVAGSKVKKKKKNSSLEVYFTERLDIIRYFACHRHPHEMFVSSDPHIIYNLYCKYILYAPGNVINYGPKKIKNITRVWLGFVEQNVVL